MPSTSSPPSSGSSICSLTSESWDNPRFYNRHTNHTTSSSSSNGASHRRCESPELNLVGLTRYVKLEKLGEGNYGCVYKARDKTTGEIVAIKKIKLEDEDEGVPSTAIREIAILQEIRHPYVVDLKDVVYENDKLYLSFEYSEMNLKQFVDCCGIKALTPTIIKLYIWQLLVGMEYCHARRVLHRDLKPQNILVDSKGRLKIADFGLARTTGAPAPPVTHEVATLWYRAPEILLGNKVYSCPLDVWGIGTPNEQIWPGVSLLPDYHPTFPKWRPQPLDKIVEPGKVDALGLDLCQKMLAYDPSQRISARDALEHPWFHGLNYKSALRQAEQLAVKANATNLTKKSKYAKKWANQPSSDDEDFQTEEQLNEEEDENDQSRMETDDEEHTSEQESDEE